MNNVTPQKDGIKQQLRRGAKRFARGWKRTVGSASRRATDRLYRFCYVLGLRSVRTVRHIAKKIKRIATPLVKGMYRGLDVVLLRGCRAIGREIHRMIGGFPLAAKHVKEAYRQHPLRAVGAAFSLPMLAVRRHREALVKFVNVVAPAGALVALLMTVSYWSGLTFALELEYEGQSLGYISDETVYDAAVGMAEEMVTDNAGTTVVKHIPKMTLVVVPKDEILDQDALCDRLMTAVSDQLTQAAGLYVDGTLIGVVDSTDRLKEMMLNALNQYRDGQGTDVATFVLPVEVVEGLYPVSAQLPDSTVQAYLNRLDVQVTTLVTYEETLPFEKKIVEDKKKYLGYSVIRTKGSNGKATYVSQVISVNGVEQSQEVLSYEITKKPVTQVTVIGAMKYDADTQLGDGKATGRFIWPVPYTKNITSKYGYRWGKMHRGLDISAAGINGKAIVASDGGKVIKVNTNGWGGGWGNYVLIDHGNGYQTRYAHCKSVVVKVGQKVAQGELIAYVGNTGNSTGPHLHFEVLLNGAYVDPLPYLQAKAK